MKKTREQRIWESGIGNRESGIGNRESGAGNRQEARGKRQEAKGKKSCLPHSYDKRYIPGRLSQISSHQLQNYALRCLTLIKAEKV